MKTRHEIDYKGLRLEVVGFYYKGAARTMDYPGDAPEFEIHDIYLNGTDIKALFRDDDYSELEDLILTEHYT